jgi:cytidylate kinase
VVVEGVHHKWVTPSLDNADLIIFLDTKYSIRIYRIIRRFILQNLELKKQIISQPSKCLSKCVGGMPILKMKVRKKF